jgi:serine/threonine protein kinase
MPFKRGAKLSTAFEKYTIQRQIGAGGSGEVYEVFDPEGKAFAIKVLDQSKATRSRLQRFENEINFCSRTSHVNIVSVIGSGVSHDGMTFYVMPLYPATLRGLISDGLSKDSILPLFGQVLDGVEAAHLVGVWHRDLKPENILANAKDGMLVVADFGIAHFEEEVLFTAVETRDDERLANFVYAAPEQRARGREVTSKADIYALASILNEMFTGIVPLGTGYRRIGEASSAHSYLDPLVEQMLSQDPNKRPSIGEVKRELIARGNAFLAAQKLDSLRSIVVPETEVDDPIIRNPIRITNVDFQNEVLHITLSSEPPRNWVAAFRNPLNAMNFIGYGPESFEFVLNRTYVPVIPGSDPQRLIDQAKTYIDKANEEYSRQVTVAHHNRIASERAALRRSVEAEERRKQVLSKLKF